LEFLDEKPTAYLDEITFFIWSEYDMDVSESTVSRVLKADELVKRSDDILQKCGIDVIDM
jgi:hypothetical protein